MKKILLFLGLFVLLTTGAYAQEPGNCNIMSTIPARGCVGTVNIYSAAMSIASNGQTLLWTIPVNQTGAYFTDAVIGGANLGTSISTIAHATVEDEPNNVLVNVNGTVTGAGSLTVQMFIQGQGTVGGCNSSRVVRDVRVVASAPALTCPTDTTTITAVATTQTASGGAFTPNANGYEYTLSPGNIVNTTGVFVGVGPGPYTILAREIMLTAPFFGCSAATTINIAAVDPSPLIATCPTPVDRAACASQAELEIIFQNWLATFSHTTGFPPVITVTNPDGVIVPLNAPNHCGGSITVTWTVTDRCLQTDTCTSTFNVRPSIAPVIVCAPGGNLGCNPTIPGPTAPQITSACPTLPYTFNDVITGTDCARILTRTYTVTNECNQTSTCDQVFTYRIDTTAPVLVGVPVGSDLGCNPIILPACNPNVTATDNCDATAAANCSAGAISSDGCGRRQVFTYSKTDSCGNNVSQDVVYTWKVDTTAPVIANLPSGGDLGCNPVRPVCSTTATATDNCDTNIIVTCTAGNVTGQPCALTQIFTYSAVDLCGNRASQDVTYTWKEDTTAPTLICIGNKEVECDAAVVFDAPGATDNCTATGNIIITPGAVVIVDNGDGTFSHTKSWTATDECNNTSAACTQTIKVLSCAEPNGCTLGYWKNHTLAWDCYTTCTLYKTVFTGSTLDPNLTLLQALNLGGGACNNLARQSVAALLNICDGTLDYSVADVAALQTLVNAAFANGTCGAAGSLLDRFNNLGGANHCDVVKSPNTSESTCTSSRTSTKKGVNATGEVAPSAIFKTYPNPFGNTFSIQSSNTVNPINVSIFDVLGRSVETRILNPDEFDSPTFGRDFPTGIYNVILNQATEQRTLRVIKK